MTRRLVESLTGVGDIHTGDLLLRPGTPYTLSVWSEDDAAGGGSPRLVVEGTIAISGMGEAVALTGADNLVLTLQDGRRLPFALASPGGRIVGKGDMR
jgi:hypothetical protein